jgi:SAM-dependent methyltransferase
MMPEKNPSSFYGTEYLNRSLKWAGGKTRWEDNGAFYNAALFAKAFLAGEGITRATTLDVGCGRGWVVRHLREMGHDSHGCEYGSDAVQYSVCKAVFGDLTEKLPFADSRFDFVSCLGVLSHLPEQNAQNAVSELARVTKHWLWTNILAMNMGGHRIPKVTDRFPGAAEQSHHLNVIGREWWYPLFRHAGLVELPCPLLEETFEMKKDPAQWQAIWVKR